MGMSVKDKLEHIHKCEFFKGNKIGVCPLIPKEEALKLMKEHCNK